jgi:hypothetical protein
MKVDDMWIGNDTARVVSSIQPRPCAAMVSGFVFFISTSSPPPRGEADKFEA